ncbi:hypothetical protein [Nocardia blacklockiae]|uniref:hypothetical protein n=1 Tax=Nocardia blacklockiae TaxID=480036 RepID=UPI001894FB61|nr:hypothetical protein [Nocardia blacklockiae]MBF6174801.1 hypothetical protein [Nocardia blacklockiae]
MLFDIRTIVGTLIGLYGVILVVTGLVNHSDADLARSGGWNTNLWAGVAMVVVALAFLAWVRLRPVKELVHQSEAQPSEPAE